MLEALSRSWALLLGVGLLMVGNGLQGTLLGIRGSLEGFSTFELSLVMSAYFVGFLGGSQMAPEMIRRVGHVRVFAALGSFISAILILFPVITNPIAWIALRVLIGFCFSGVYVTAESWLNNSASNENRGKALSLYMIVQMIGIVTAQGILTLGDPSGYILFIVPSVLVSIAFAPILLSISPTPAFHADKKMGFLEIFRRLPLSCVGTILMGGVFSALFGMSAVYGTGAGFSVAQVSLFVSAIYVGGLVMQFPIGILSDRMDRRQLIMVMAIFGFVTAMLGVFSSSYPLLVVSAFFVGGMSNPLYALLIAYANDHLQPDDMAAASGRLLFLNGIGAIAGPIVTGWLIGVVGPAGFYVYLAGLMAALAAYSAYRMTRRAAPPRADDAGGYVPVSPQATPVAVDAVGEIYTEQVEDADDRQQDGNVAAE